MRFPLIGIVLLMQSLTMFRCEAQPASSKPPELELLTHYVGSWQAETTRTYANENSASQQFRSSSRSETVLDGWFVQGIKNSYFVEAPDRITKDLTLATYAPETKQYVSWNFQSNGNITSWRGTWDPDIEVMHWQSKTAAARKPFEVKVFFTDKQTIRSELSNETETGDLFFEKTNRTRKKGALLDLTAELWSKIETPIRPIPHQVKVLEPLVGEWDAEYTQFPSAAFPEGSTTKATITGQWILDGRFLLGRSKLEQYETMWVIGYDTVQQAYRYVRFDNRGEIEENVGQWNDATRSFEWNVVHGKPGQTKRAVVYIIGNDTVQSRITSEDADGKVLLDLLIRSQRKKQ